MYVYGLKRAIFMENNILRSFILCQITSNNKVYCNIKLYHLLIYFNLPIQRKMYR